jgi:hypothetical protein
MDTQDYIFGVPLLNAVGFISFNICLSFYVLLNFVVKKSKMATVTMVKYHDLFSV